MASLLFNWRRRALTSIFCASFQEIRGNIRVHCRLRPLISRLDSPGDEESLGREGTPSERVVALLDEEKLMVRPTKPVGGQMQRKEFEFERVYSPDTDQQSLFEDVAPLLTSLLDGWVRDFLTETTLLSFEMKFLRRVWVSQVVSG